MGSTFFRSQNNDFSTTNTGSETAPEPNQVLPILQDHCCLWQTSSLRSVLNLLNVPLLTINAAQLRYILDQDSHPYKFFMLALIGTSIILQTGVAIGYILNRRNNHTLRPISSQEMEREERNNTIMDIGSLFVVVLNAFITGFGVGPHI